MHVKNIDVNLGKNCHENRRAFLPAQPISLPHRSEQKKDDDLVFDVEESGLANYTVTGQEGIIEASHGLVTATAVVDDKFDIPISYAQTFEEKIPFHRNKRVITYAIGFVLILIIVATGSSFAATKKVIDMGIITDIPSAAPSIPPTSTRDSLGIWERLSELSGPNILLARAGDIALQKTPQYKAAYWIINDDERQMGPNDDMLEQRYILALIYFATNGPSWKDCSFDSNLDECTYFDYGFQSNFTESRYLSGSHECDWFQTYCSNDKIVRDLHLYNNNLSGTIPSEVAALTKLRTLWLNANSLTGTLPTELGTLRHLASLEVHSNQIYGTLPSEIFNIDTLQSLNVAMNEFYGTIPDLFENLKNLKGIHMFENAFSGRIPASIGTMPYLSFVFLQGNRLTGVIPSSLFSINRMRQLLLNENRLTGTLATHIGQMKDLEILMLNDNNLEGTLPDELYDLESLEWLYLQSNKFNGNIASDIGKLKNLKRLLFRLNDFTGTIPKEIGHLRKLDDLWLHFNKLEGDMPEQICGLTDYGLGSLMADCLDEFDQAALDCECCTDCCDRKQEVCFKDDNVFTERL